MRGIDNVFRNICTLTNFVLSLGFSRVFVCVCVNVCVCVCVGVYVCVCVGTTTRRSPIIPSGLSPHFALMGRKFSRSAKRAALIVLRKRGS